MSFQEAKRREISNLAAYPEISRSFFARYDIKRAALKEQRHPLRVALLLWGREISYELMGIWQSSA